jgi:fatty acid desaturase
MNKDEKVRRKRIPKGFNFEGNEKNLQKVSSRTSLLISIGVALTDWAIILFCTALGAAIYFRFGFSFLTVIVHILFILPLCARALRGKENLVHEASHYNLHRQSHKINDLVGNWLCAYWLLLSVKSYRITHTKHHAYFGSGDDPDKQRFERLKIDDMPRASIPSLAKYLVAVFPAYWLDYWKQFSNKIGQFVGSIALHLIFVVAISFFYPGFWVLWLVYWWLPFVVYLPFLRFFAEAEEHRYENAESEYDSTFSNLGFLQKWFFHPHGDAYHLLHHIAPQIPHWRMSNLHWVFSAIDEKFREGSVRMSILESTEAAFPKKQF